MTTLPPSPPTMTETTPEESTMTTTEYSSHPLLDPPAGSPVATDGPTAMSNQGAQASTRPVDFDTTRRRWEVPAVIALLVITAALYLWDLGSSGWANTYYSAAVQAGTESWKAFFFGSFDAANAITVDKPPASLWVMEISARIFGASWFHKR